MAPLLEHCELIPFDDLEALERKLHGRDFAAFIVEPIQGEGGFVVPAKGYLKGAEALCRKYGTLLILDEIQTGFGRTGTMFALEHEGVVPDIVTLSKSLGSGVVPISVWSPRRPSGRRPLAPGTCMTSLSRLFQETRRHAPRP